MYFKFELRSERFNIHINTAPVKYQYLHEKNWICYIIEIKTNIFSIQSGHTKLAVFIISDINPFTPESDQCQISPAASASILHRIVWRT